MTSPTTTIQAESANLKKYLMTGLLEAPGSASPQKVRPSLRPLDVRIAWSAVSAALLRDHQMLDLRIHAKLPMPAPAYPYSAARGYRCYDFRASASVGPLTQPAPAANAQARDPKSTRHHGGTCLLPRDRASYHATGPPTTRQDLGHLSFLRRCRRAPCPLCTVLIHIPALVRLLPTLADVVFSDGRHGGRGGATTWPS